VRRRFANKPSRFAAAGVRSMDDAFVPLIDKIILFKAMTSNNRYGKVTVRTSLPSEEPVMKRV
jgi:hypothetical protein